MQKTIGRFFSFFTAMLLCVNMFTVFAAGAEESTQVDEEPTMSNDMSIEGSNSFGTMLAKEISGKQEEQLENNGCNVFSVEVSGQTAKVDFETTEDLSLVVAIYEEDGVKMLTSAETDVTAEQTDVEVTFEEQLPQYFYLRAFLVEKESLKPMCVAYETPNYTKEMQEFFAKTTDDFDEERVLNLDEDKTNNFAVFDEDTRIIENAGDKNILVSSDDENLTYVFENADESISGLKKDDIFTYALEDGTQLIVKVDSVKTDGSKVTIAGQDTSMEDMFEYVKIDTDKNKEPPVVTVEDTTMSEGVTVVEDNKYSLKEAVADINEGFTIGKEFKLDDISKEITGFINFNAGASLKVYISSSKQYMELKVDYSVGIKVNFKHNCTETLELASFTISPVPGCYITFTPGIIVEATINGTLSGTIGFNVSLQSGYKDLTTTPNFKSDAKIETSFFVGLSLEPEVKVISDNIANARMIAKTGAEVKVTIMDENSKEEHLCNHCIEGEINAKLSVSAKATFLNLKKATINFNMLEIKVKIADFYYSADFDDFGFTKCPHKTYKTEIKIVDNKTGEAVPYATINFNHETDSSGKITLYLPVGINNIVVDKAGYSSVTKGINVNNQGTTSEIIKIAKNDVDSSSSKPDSSSKNDTEIVGEEIQQVSLGSGHSACITKDGKLYTWGANGYGQLGDGTTTSRCTPVKIMDNVAQVSLGCHRCSACITKDGKLYTWGYNEYGQLGDGTTEDRYEPVEIMDNVVQVSLGAGHSACITKDGSLYTWGFNFRGQLGDGTTGVRYEPVKIMDNVVSVSLGFYHNACITKDGSLYTWGWNSHGDLGDGTTEDKYEPVEIMDNVAQVSLGGNSSACITKDGKLYTWGSNGNGELGDGTTENRYKPVEIMDNVASVSLGDSHSACITKDGKLYTWGFNSAGRLGDGTTESSNKPVEIMGNVASVSLGSVHSACITKDGNLYTWGGNRYGQLGDGTTTNKSTPTPITIPKETTRNLNTAANPTSLKSVESSKTNQSEFADIESLEPNTVYNIYVMKDKSAENPLSTENLLCITQTKTDENGNITTKYAPKAEIAGAETFAVNFADDEENEQPEIVIGDVDFSGTINSSDALKVLIHIVGVKRLDENQFKAADTNGDNEITTIDALNILKYVVGLISQFTA